jgi:hypothetical protein
LKYSQAPSGEYSGPSRCLRDSSDSAMASAQPVAWRFSNA